MPDSVAPAAGGRWISSHGAVAVWRKQSLRKGLGRPSAPSSPRSHSVHHCRGRRSRDSRRQRVRQIFTYSGFPGCRGDARHPGCSAHDSASFAHGPVNTTCSMARNSGRSLAPHAYLTLSRDSSVSIESTEQFFGQSEESGVSGVTIL